MEITLTEKKCVPCEGGTPPLGEAEIKEYQGKLKTEWGVIDGKKISRKFVFRSFKEAIAFVHKVAELSEEEGHHPDIRITYNRVTIELTTHAIGGLSENDFIMGSKIELLATKEGWG